MTITRDTSTAASSGTACGPRRNVSLLTESSGRRASACAGLPPEDQAAMAEQPLPRKAFDEDARAPGAHRAPETADLQHDPHLGTTSRQICQAPMKPAVLSP